MRSERFSIPMVRGVPLVWVLLLLMTAANGVFANGEHEGAVIVPPEAAAVEEAEQSVAAPQPPPSVHEWTFEDILEKVWRLAAIRIGYGSIQLNRAAMKSAGMDEIYVLQFKEEGINGKALFNYYFAPFVKHEGKEIAFRQIVGTRMASPDTINAGGLGEEEYYWYLQRVTHWNIVSNRLELYTGDGEITLYFIL